MVGNAPAPQERIAIVTVHGTGDTAQGPEGEKWFQKGAIFTNRLRERLAAQGIQADIHPHLWSGANSAQGREQGARKLSEKLRGLSRQYRSVHVIGHSHGGNVANEAALMLGWKLRPKRPQKITSITTVGTPFFRSQLGAAEAFGGLAFLVLVVLSIITLIIGALLVAFWSPTLHGDPLRYASEAVAHAAQTGLPPPTAAQTAEYVRERMEEYKDLHPISETLRWIVYIGAAALFFVLPLAVQGMLRILRILRKQQKDATIFSIWHEHDEAIAFLKRVEELPIEPFPRWALWRSSRTSGIVWGVRAVIATFLISASVLVAGLLGNSSAGVFTTVHNVIGIDAGKIFGDEPLTEIGALLMVATILCAPLLFGFFYLLTRLLRGLAFEMVGRGWLNTTVSAVLRGMAFGRDGDERIGQVATCSHTFGSRVYVLQGEVSDRMMGNAAKAASSLIEKYRWSLFSVGKDTNDSLGKLATDAMTWDSLIHTTYFDQPEMPVVIGDYIAENVDRQRG